MIHVIYKYPKRFHWVALRYEVDDVLALGPPERPAKPARWPTCLVPVVLSLLFLLQLLLLLLLCHRRLRMSIPHARFNERSETYGCVSPWGNRRRRCRCRRFGCSSRCEGAAVLSWCVETLALLTTLVPPARTAPLDMPTRGVHVRVSLC